MLVHLVLQVNPSQVLKVHKVQLVHQVLQVNLLQGLKAQQVPKAHKVLQELKELLVHQVQAVQVVHQEFQV